MRLDADELRLQLKKDGFKETYAEYDHDYDAYSYSYVGHGIRIAFCVSNTNFGYATLNNRVGVESIKTFNKWSQVPVSLKLPVDYEELTKWILWCDSPEGMEVSNHFETGIYEK